MKRTTRWITSLAAACLSFAGFMHSAQATLVTTEQVAVSVGAAQRDGGARLRQHHPGARGRRRRPGRARCQRRPGACPCRGADRRRGGRGGAHPRDGAGWCQRCPGHHPHGLPHPRAPTASPAKASPRIRGVALGRGRRRSALNSSSRCSAARAAAHACRSRVPAATCRRRRPAVSEAAYPIRPRPHHADHDREPATCGSATGSRQRADESMRRRRGAPRPVPSSACRGRRCGTTRWWWATTSRPARCGCAQARHRRRRCRCEPSSTRGSARVHGPSSRCRRGNGPRRRRKRRRSRRASASSVWRRHRRRWWCTAAPSRVGRGVSRCRWDWAIALYATGDKAAAAEAFRVAAERNRSAPAWINLASTSMELGRREEALAAARPRPSP